MQYEDTSESETEITKIFMNALEDNSFDTVRGLLGDDFTFSGWTPRPLNKKEFLETMRGLKEGLPGLIFNLHNVSSTADHRVAGSIQVTGYQSDSFILPALGTPPIPQMARSVSLPSEEVEFAIAEGKITRLNVQVVQGGGIRGLLEQLGVELRLIQ